MSVEKGDEVDPAQIGRYRILRRLGAGGMGTVYLAHDTGSLDREVAVKLMLPSAAADVGLRERFEREAKLLALINHPNVVVVHDSGSHEGTPYIVMERLLGSDLKEAMAEARALDFDRRVKIIIDVLAGLTQAHEVGIVHRDIKPANVFLGREGSVKVVDFGLARVVTAPISEVDKIVGTAAYMSPEQVQGLAVTGASDLFSVGSLLCELLGDAPPFSAQSQTATLFRIVHWEPNFEAIPKDRRHSALLAILAKALAKQPEKRYTSAKEFATALEGLIHASPGAQTLAQKSQQPNVETGLVSDQTTPLGVSVTSTDPGGAPARHASIPTPGPDAFAPNEASYILGQHRANAIRLVGAADESFPAKFVDLKYDPTPYSLPAAFRGDYSERLARIRQSALNRGAQFHDGPCVRLVTLAATARDPSERKYLQITLGPIGWFEFSVVDDRIHEATTSGAYGEFVASFVDVGRIRAGDFSNSPLPNIVETMTSVLSADGQLLYHERRGVSTVPDMLSTISENVHRSKDDNPDRIGTPDLSRTVLRGIEEELSPKIADRISLRDVTLIGLCYNLEELHPTFLFLVRLPIAVRDVFTICREWPGKDFAEGQLHSLPAQRDDPRWSTALASTWYASGKASVIRSLEFLDYERRG